ncbi:hypothetical protein GYMLUDRAFT_249195 [Collybiopsis luxurians FD-317 M1]|uniref:Uncharacterized protein n=1 Tax=Collybiopsis luxurians FD-317 M1 TaxID=944289 RepID=A0A0D0BYC5_9AGAR|nr:hypothetical protein GYMLUDRAFT_249195 [Collybiopsis luxurians FD-317 M1]
MIPSSEVALEPWPTSTTIGSIARFPTEEQDLPAPSLNQRGRRTSLYSIVTGRTSSLFSNLSQRTITVSTSLQSSSTSISNLHSNSSNHSYYLRPFSLKKAKSSVIMRASSEVAGPSNLTRSNSITAIRPHQEHLSGKSDVTPVAIELQVLGDPHRETVHTRLGKDEEDETQLSHLDKLNKLPQRITFERSPTDVPKARIVGRGGVGSRPRRTHKQPIFHLHQSERDPSAIRTTTSSSDGSTVTRYVGRGGLGRIRLNPLLPVTNLSSSISRDSGGSRQHSSLSSSTTSQSLVSDGSSPLSLFRVSGRGGAGSRPRRQTLASAPSTKMFKIKWGSRKKSTSDAGLQPRIQTSTHGNPLRFVALKRTRSHTVPASTDDKIRPLSTIAASPRPSTTIEFDSNAINSNANSTSPSLSAYLNSSDSPVPADHREKLERTLGDAVPLNMLLSTSTRHGGDDNSFIRRTRRQSYDSASLSSTRRSHRRRSIARSLSSLGSLIRLPRSSPNVHTQEHDDHCSDFEEEVCWVDNEFDPSSRNGMSTPVSPMIFSERPPSPVPPPKPRLLMGPRPQPPRPLTRVYPQLDSLESSEGGSEDGIHGVEDELYEDDGTHSELFTPITTPDGSGAPETPLSSTSLCDPLSPLSPIVFSDRPVSMLPPSGENSVSQTDLTPRMELQNLLSEPSHPLTTLPALNLMRPFSPDSSSVLTNDLTDSPIRSSLLLPPRAKRDALHTWTGAWNRTDMQEVIQSLRELK